jgi:hypothetical protein
LVSVQSCASSAYLFDLILCQSRHFAPHYPDQFIQLRLKGQLRLGFVCSGWTKTMIDVLIVLPVLIMSCQVSEKLNSARWREN